MRYMRNAITNVEKQLDCERYVGKVKFQYNPETFLRLIKPSTSAGLYQLVPKSSTVLKFKDNGVKALVLMAVLMYFHSWIFSIMKGKPLPFQPYNVIKMKSEFRVWWQSVGEELAEKQDKVRNFFIPSLLMIVLSLLFYPRLEFECGNMIRVKMRWWYGGAYEVYKLMNGSRKDIFWVDGDVYHFDKSIQDIFLYVYISAGQRYYDVNKMSFRQKKRFMNMQLGSSLTK